MNKANEEKVMKATRGKGPLSLTLQILWPLTANVSSVGKALCPCRKGENVLRGTALVAHLRGGAGMGRVQS